jgi:hypothetical protein
MVCTASVAADIITDGGTRPELSTSLQSVTSFANLTLSHYLTLAIVYCSLKQRTHGFGLIAAPLFAGGTIRRINGPNRSACRVLLDDAVFSSRLSCSLRRTHVPSLSVDYTRAVLDACSNDSYVS